LSAQKFSAQGISADRVLSYVTKATIGRKGGDEKWKTFSCYWRPRLRATAQNRLDGRPGESTLVETQVAQRFLRKINRSKQHEKI